MLYKAHLKILGQNPPGQNPPDKTPRTIPRWTKPPDGQNPPVDKTPPDKTPPDKTPPDKTPRTKPPLTKPPHSHKAPYKTPQTQNTTAKSKMAFILNSDGFRALLLINMLSGKLYVYIQLQMRYLIASGST